MTTTQFILIALGVLIAVLTVVSVLGLLPSLYIAEPMQSPYWSCRQTGQVVCTRVARLNFLDGVLLLLFIYP